MTTPLPLLNPPAGLKLTWYRLDFRRYRRYRLKSAMHIVPSLSLPLGPWECGGGAYDCPVRVGQNAPFFANQLLPGLILIIMA